MGLKEQLNAGATELKRSTVSFNISGSTNIYQGSLSLGRTFILINTQASTPCRIRLYSDSGSRDDLTEIARPYISQSIPSAISLIADVDITDGNLFNFYPPVFGANLDNAVASNIYYTITSSSVDLSGSTHTVAFNRFVMEDSKVQNVVTRNHYLITGSIPTGNTLTGSIVTPKTYLLLQTIPNASPLRLRLYARESYRDIPSEISRPFGVEPSASSGLIADMYMGATETSSFTPVVLGRNMEQTPASTTYFSLTNDSGTSDISASLYLFSLED